jgi:bifunctional DNA-binding transcriptional regulator/antitoxin component of YhaV-PrlF toxin-antitoxin module
MSKLQKIVRKNNSEVYSVNLPLEVIENVGWEKGQNLDVKEDGENVIISKKEEEDGGSDEESN